jgi:hypothetical protein
LLTLAQLGIERLSLAHTPAGQSDRAGPAAP